MAKKTLRRMNKGSDRPRSGSQVRKKRGPNIPNRIEVYASAESVPVAEAARILGVSVTTIKRMRKDGQLRCFSTHGGHIRIPRAELDRIQAGDEERQIGSPNPVSDSLKSRRQLIEDLTLRAQTIRAQQELKKVDEEAAELDAKRDARKREEENQRVRAAREARIQSQLNEEREEAEAERVRMEQGRREWISAWQAWALRQMPTDAREFDLDVHQAVEEVLLRLWPTQQPREIVERVVCSAIEKALKPYARQKHIDQAVQLARKQLPLHLQRYFEPSEWELKAMARASDAIGALPADSGVAELSQVGIQAGREVASEHEVEETRSRREAQEATQRDDRERRKKFLSEFGVVQVGPHIAFLLARDLIWQEDVQKKPELEAQVRDSLSQQLKGTEDLEDVRARACKIVEQIIVG